MITILNHPNFTVYCNGCGTKGSLTSIYVPKDETIFLDAYCDSCKDSFKKELIEEHLKTMKVQG